MKPQATRAPRGDPPCPLSSASVIPARTIAIPLAAGGILVLATKLRLAQQRAVTGDLPRLVAFPDPPARVPFLDVLAWPAAVDRLQLSLLLSLLTVAAVGLLVRRALPEGGRLVGMGLAALCPTLVITGSVSSPHVLLILCACGASLALIEVLRSNRRSPPLVLAAATTALLISDWPAASPVLAWIGWLLFFRPRWLAPRRTRRALIGLGMGSVLPAFAYAGIMYAGAQPAEVLGRAHFPVGAEAARQLLGSISGLWLGMSTAGGLTADVLIGLLLIGLAILGWKRAHRAGAPAWASVLLVGSLGALVPALAIHQALPFAAYKNVWFMTPMLLTLSVAAFWPIVQFQAEHPADSPEPVPTRSAASLLVGALTMRSFLCLAGVGLLSLSSCTDQDGDGWTTQSGDCDDNNEAIHPGAPESWDDGIDNDCDGTTDWSDDYVLLAEAEPNDSSLGSCFAPEGQDLGRIAGSSLLTRIDGRIETVVDQSYEEGDRDCYAFRLPTVEDHPRLTIHLSWDDAESDLDLALQGLWEGVQVGFAQSQASGPGPEFLVSSSGFDSGAPLWLWVVGYDGPPTDYRVDLVLR